MRNTLCLVFSLLLAIHADAQTKDAPQTLMLQPGKLLVSEDLNQPLGKEWFGNPGDWKIVDGVLRGSERADDMHAAVRRRNVKFDHAVVAFQLRLENAKAMSLSMNAEKGHVCRVRVAPDGLTVQRDKDKVKNEKPVQLDKANVKIDPKVWHTMIVEMSGKEMVARLDRKHVAFGVHDGLTATKHSVGFTVQGDGVSFKNLRVYEGSPMSSWEATKTKLIADRKK
jgi:hypothetical protein